MSRYKLLITVLFLGLILAFVYLFTGYFKEQNIQADIVKQVETSNQTLKLFPPPPAGLTERLDQVILANRYAKQRVSGENINSIEIINSILKAADGCDLKTNPLITDQWMKRSYGTSTYRLLPIELTITGQLSDLIIFIGQLENKESFSNLAIENLTITNQSVLNQADNAAGAAQSITVNLTISIITRLEAGN